MLSALIYATFLSYHSKKDQFKIVPILVGGLKPEAEAKFGRILSKYLIKPENFFVISSDFCHWGKYKVEHMIYKFLKVGYLRSGGDKRK